MVEISRFLSVCLMVALSAAGCSKSAHTPSGGAAPVIPVTDKPAVLATISPDDKPVSFTMTSGASFHGESKTELQFVFSDNGGGVAYIVEKSGLSQVVHNSRPGKPYKAVGTLRISPDGRRIAYGALLDGKWRMVVDGVEGEPFNTVKEPLFSPDGRHVAYQAMKGEKWHLVVDTTANAGTKTRYLDHQFSGNGNSIVWIDNADEEGKKGRLVVSDTGFKNERVIDPAVTRMVLNADKTSVAAVARNIAGKERVLQFSFATPETVTRWGEYDKIHSPSFASTGAAVTFVGERAGRMSVCFNGQEEYLPAGLMPGALVVNPVTKAAGTLMYADNRVFPYQAIRNSGRLAANGYEEGEGLVYSQDGAKYAFTARSGAGWFVVVNGADGPVFDKVVSPKFSPDGKYLVYRARKDGSRFVVVADSSGKTLRQHPAYEQVFDVQFTADGKSVAYGVKDGQQLAWKVEKL